MVLFFAKQGSNPSNFFKRHYLAQYSSTTFSLRMSHLKMLSSNQHCIGNCTSFAVDASNRSCALSNCYYELWLYRRVLLPLNCTLFYIEHEAAQRYEVCDPDLIVRKYNEITDPKLNGTKVVFARR